jgi:hypothetical protein
MVTCFLDFLAVAFVPVVPGVDAALLVVVAAVVDDVLGAATAVEVVVVAPLEAMMQSCTE